MHEDELDGKGRDFGNEDATECIRERGVDADEGEGGIERFVFVEFDTENLVVEKVSTKGMVLRNVMFVGTFSKFCRLHELSSPG